MKIGHFNIHTVNIKRIRRECHGQIYVNKFETGETDKFLGKPNLLKLK